MEKNTINAVMEKLSRLAEKYPDKEWNDKQLSYCLFKEEYERKEKKIKEKQEKYKEEILELRKNIKTLKKENKSLKEKNKSLKDIIFPKPKPKKVYEYALNDVFRNYVNSNIQNLDDCVDPNTGFHCKLINMSFYVVKDIVTRIIDKNKYQKENNEGKNCNYIKYNKELYEIMDFEIKEGEREHMFNHLTLIQTMRKLKNNGHFIEVISDY